MRLFYIQAVHKALLQKLLMGFGGFVFAIEPAQNTNRALNQSALKNKKAA